MEKREEMQGNVVKCSDGAYSGRVLIHAQPGNLLIISALFSFLQHFLVFCGVKWNLPVVSNECFYLELRAENSKMAHLILEMNFLLEKFPLHFLQ